MPDQKPDVELVQTENSKPRKIRGAHTVCEKLREEILWMKLSPGSALDEISLAKRFEVSRTPVREALLILSGEGYVRFLPNRTTIVAPLSIENVRAFFDTFLVLSRSMARSAALEGNIEISQLQDMQSEFSQHLRNNDFASAMKSHRSLYSALSAATDNLFLNRYCKEIQNASVRTKLLFYFPYLTNEEKESAITNNNSVISRVIDGNDDESDRAISDAILFEAKIITRAISPQFGHTMDLSIAKELSKVTDDSV